jgi:hypothetical protein
MSHSNIGYMELALPTPVSHPPSLEWCLHTARHTDHSKVLPHPPKYLLLGYTIQCTGTIQGKEGGIQVLAGLAKQTDS